MLEAVEALGALAHETRLEIFRLLVRRGSEGLAVSQIAEHVKIPPATLSFHLSHLQRAGLIHSQRLSRQIIYSARYPLMKDLLGFLTENCCEDAGMNDECKETTQCPN
ncbi:ArsR/SmtB family transcription factor [Vampirovibrio sp.]|uniref:ArsR/SmtB family transcription factor n=1 Tax=Vampirovibrio sp. TaxID=2717857 RepID=UPI00359444F2